MAPFTSLTGPTLQPAHTQRSVSNECVGWSCLSDAAQFGVILVVIAFVAALGYIYWRFQFKPNRQLASDEARVSDGTHCEFTREGSNRVSITIYREPRPRESQGDEETENTKSQAPRRKKRNEESTQIEENTSQPPQQVGNGGASTMQPIPPSEIHMIPPPPPPPVLWTFAPPSILPPPPPFGPPILLAPGPPPHPLTSGPLGLNPGTIPCPSYAPPPYFSQHGSQNLHQEQTRGTETVFHSAGTPQPTRWSKPPSNHPRGAAQRVPSPRPQPQRRRWFSMGAALPQTGHARTLSDSDSPAPKSRSPSPPPPSISPPTPNRGRGRLRHTSDRRLRLRSPGHRSAQQFRHPRWQNARGIAQDQRENNSPYQSSLGLSSANTSMEAVHGSQESWAGHRGRVYESPSPERRRYSDRGPRANMAGSDSVPLSNLRQQRLPSPDPRPGPSPDIQFPSPEPHRAHVSFSLPRDSNDAFTYSPQQSGSLGSSSVQYSQLENPGDIASRRSQARRDREQDVSNGQVSGIFGRMRRALRGSS